VGGRGGGEKVFFWRKCFFGESVCFWRECFFFREGVFLERESVVSKMGERVSGVFWFWFGAEGL
jgi:hypothetical protein